MIGEGSNESRSKNQKNGLVGKRKKQKKKVKGKRKEKEGILGEACTHKSVGSSECTGSLLPL